MKQLLTLLLILGSWLVSCKPALEIERGSIYSVDSTQHTLISHTHNPETINTFLRDNQLPPWYLITRVGNNSFLIIPTTISPDSMAFVSQQYLSASGHGFTEIKVDGFAKKINTILKTNPNIMIKSIESEFRGHDTQATALRITFGKSL